MTDYYTYGASTDKAFFAISTADNSGAPSTAAGQNYFFLQCNIDGIEIDGQRLSKTSQLAGGYSYNARTGKKGHNIIFKGMILKKSANVTTDIGNIAKMLQVQEGSVAPLYAYVIFLDPTAVYFPFNTTSTSTFVNYLKGYVKSFKFKPKDSALNMELSGTFEECQS